MLLHDVPVFAALSPDDLKQIADLAREQWYVDGSFICREGEDGHEMYVLAAGQVRVTKGAGQNEKFLATRYAGDFIGENSQPGGSFLRSGNASEHHQHPEDLSLEPDRLNVHDRPDVALAVLRGVMRRLREKE